MSEPVLQRRDDDRSGSPERAVTVFFAFVLFLAGLAMFWIAFEVVEAARPWVFFGGIASVSLAFAIPTTIVPALEDR
ncbi:MULTISPECIES: hypothetical protein [Cellulomonas]|uniref:Uncharacterized protein n=1 Tax=Cellulomonas gilvus (strain ATCC 13127 / NRRL B-14078) TaxID=593907 RepID=F8A0Z8_CELGA|nr:MULTISPECIES: hypothetical protein [Cellulomonas]AEI12756.1 hypothetical protein Celgi_2256 [Cellulomonas gilvus ATCC 13127]MCR6689494.1 hypothetical protein [Cellulomonas sp.]